MSLHHFYHIYADGNWREPVSEHVRALKESGLFEALKTFSIGIVGSDANRIEVHKYLIENFTQFSICDQQQNGWEQVTQIPMWEFCKGNEGLMLYAHSKGSSDGNEVNVRWRRSMIYCNVIKWKEAVEKLKDHDAYGCHWIQPIIGAMPEHAVGNWMFAGTFFWLRCEVLARFPRPALTHRHEAEGFVGYGWHEQPYKVYDPTPYFPNSGPFADGWICDPNFTFNQEGKSYG